MALFIFLADVQRARWKIRIYMFITINVGFFRAMLGLMAKIRQPHYNIQHTQNAVVWSQNIPACVQTRVQVGQPSNRGSIPERGKRVFFFF